VARITSFASGLLAANDDEREPFSSIRVEITARDTLKNCSDQGSRLLCLAIFDLRPKG
jgi:hypothetical protein